MKGIVPMGVFCLILSCSITGPAQGPGDGTYSEAVARWAYIFEPSVLDYDERLEELRWFEFVSEELSGMRILSAAENIETHYWESQFLTRAFEEITGISVTHEIMGEGDLVLKMMDQIENNNFHYDIYVNDSDMVGTHLRMDSVVILSDFAEREGWQYTNPYLDTDDFLNLDMGRDYEGNLLQLPDQQFANLYWFRYDWFSRNDIARSFKEQYGYDLGVPLNWSAYEDIAEFFSNNEIDGKKVYGHLDYGKPSHSLGWRFTDAWLAMAGVGDGGLPNGSPVDEWGIRVENNVPVGSSVSRGGALNGPASVYALEKYIKWMDLYAPPQAKLWEWVDAGPLAARGDIAQRIFQYTTWLSDDSFHKPSSPVTDNQGRPLWRVAPSPHGKYWDDSMKAGYQDCGSWTIPSSTEGKRRLAAWLWAQFCVSKTVSLKKFTVGGTPVRKSTVFSDYLSERIEQYGGIIEFYRSRDQLKWTDSGLNVPYYPEMSSLWWKNIAGAVEGIKSPGEALNDLAEQQDELMSGLNLLQYSPRLNEREDPSSWLDREGSPKKEILGDEPPRTVKYEKLLETWRRNQ